MLGCQAAIAGDFSIQLGTNPNWPTNGLGPVNFTMTDEFGFELDVLAQIARFGGSGVNGWPNETNAFGTALSLGLVYDAGTGNSGIGESTNTATLSFTSGGQPFAVDRVEFIISDIDSVDNNGATDRCDFVTATGNNGNPTLSYISTNTATRSVVIGPGPGAGSTGNLASNQAQCVYNLGATGSPRSQADDNGSVLAVWPSGTSVVSVSHDESIENVLGQTNRNAAARGIGIWSSSIITVDQSISLQKAADQSFYVTQGDTLTYTYTVTNDGPLPITSNQDIVIEDDVIGTISCPAITSDIPVNGTLICTASYNTTTADGSSSNVTNNAVAGVGTPGQAFATRLQSNQSSATVPREIGSLTLIKSVGSPTVAAGASPTLTDGGDTLSYSYEITNTGNTTLNNVTISDPGPTFDGNPGTGTLSPFSPASANILAGSSQIFTATYTLSQSDVDNSAGVSNAVSNTANASGSTPGGQTPISNDSSAQTTIGGGPALSVIKEATPESDVPAGTIVTYTYRVRNTGNQTLSNINLLDVHNGTGTSPVPGNETISDDQGPTGDSSDTAQNGVWELLAVNDEVTFTATYTVTQQDVNTLQ